MEYLAAGCWDWGIGLGSVLGCFEGNKEKTQEQGGEWNDSQLCFLFMTIHDNGILSLDSDVEVSQSVDSVVVVLNAFDYNIDMRKDCDGGVSVQSWKYCFYGKNRRTEDLGYLRRI